METKQTAVDWLMYKMTKNVEIRWRGVQYQQLFKQAKEIEKEQIKNAFIDGEHQQGFEGEPKQYYEETYGK